MRRLVVLGAAVVMLLALAPTARACSCAGGDPRATLARSDGAFIGTVVSAPEQRMPGHEQAAWEFTVERAVKGDVKERVTVWSASDGGMCGLELQKGSRTGLFLYREGERWTSSLCSRVDPDALVASASPLPAPDGSGPPAFVVGGELGDVGLVALDEQGRTLAYGEAEGRAAGMAVCPGGRRVAAARFVEPGRARVVLFELPGLGVVRSREMGSEADYPMAVGCGDAAGDDVYVFFEKPASPQSEVSLYRLRRDEPQAVVWRGPGMVPEFDPGGRFAIVPVKEPASLVFVELPSGRSRPLGALSQPASRVAVHPAGRKVLVMAASWEGSTPPPAQLMVIGTDGRVLAERSLPGPFTGSGFLWSGDDQVTVSTGERTVETFDGRLRPRGSWEGELGWETVVRDGRLFALNHEGELRRGDPRTGGLALWRDLPDGSFSALAALPRVEASGEPATTTSSAPPATTTTAPPVTTTAPPTTELAADPASSSDGGGSRGDVPGAVGTAAVLALIGSAFAARRRLRRV